MVKPRCIHWYYIRQYRGFRQKVGYVVRRLLGMRTPSADTTSTSALEPTNQPGNTGIL